MERARRELGFSMGGQLQGRPPNALGDLGGLDGGLGLNSIYNALST
jgi:hypothetical protein